MTSDERKRAFEELLGRCISAAIAADAANTIYAPGPQRSKAEGLRRHMLAEVFMAYNGLADLYEALRTDGERPCCPCQPECRCRACDQTTRERHEALAEAAADDRRAGL